MITKTAATLRDGMPTRKAIDAHRDRLLEKHLQGLVEGGRENMEYLRRALHGEQIG